MIRYSTRLKLVVVRSKGEKERKENRIDRDFLTKRASQILRDFRVDGDSRNDSNLGKAQEHEGILNWRNDERFAIKIKVDPLSTRYSHVTRSRSQSRTTVQMSGEKTTIAAGKIPSRSTA